MRARQVLREGIAKHGGYEINTEGDAFHIAFKGVVEAVAFAMDVQYRLLEMPWSRDVLRLPTCREARGPEGEVLFRGPRVRMGVHFAAEGTVVHRRGLYCLASPSSCSPILEMPLRLCPLSSLRRRASSCTSKGALLHLHIELSRTHFLEPPWLPASPCMCRLPDRGMLGDRHVVGRGWYQWWLTEGRKGFFG
jgi:hypothetical protein